MDGLRESLSRPETFAGLYMFCFDFSRERGQKSLNMSMAEALLGLLLPGRFELLPEFLEFLSARVRASGSLGAVQVRMALVLCGRDRACRRPRDRSIPCLATRGSSS